MDEKQNNEELWATAVFGKQVEDFLATDVGRYLLDRAESDWQKAVIAIRDCKPEELLKYQADMKRSESVRGWLSQAVNEGLRAYNLLQENEDEIE
jgi:hypothetical protein